MRTGRTKGPDCHQPGPFGPSDRDHSLVPRASVRSAGDKPCGRLLYRPHPKAIPVASCTWPRDIAAAPCAIWSGCSALARAALCLVGFDTTVGFPCAPICRYLSTASTDSPRPSSAAGATEEVSLRSVDAGADLVPPTRTFDNHQVRPRVQPWRAGAKRVIHHRCRFAKGTTAAHSELSRSPLPHPCYHIGQVAVSAVSNPPRNVLPLHERLVRSRSCR